MWKKIGSRRFGDACSFIIHRSYHHWYAVCDAGGVCRQRKPAIPERPVRFVVPVAQGAVPTRSRAHGRELAARGAAVVVTPHRRHGDIA